MSEKRFKLLGEWCMFICKNEFVYWNQTYLFRFYDKKTANIFCDLCNLFLKYNAIRTFEKEKGSDGV